MKPFSIDARQHGQHRRLGFTLVELLVVVSMIALLLSFSVPLVFKIDELSRDRSGVNTIGVAVTAARAYATRRIADLDTTPQAEYSGAAVLVMPQNRLRIIADLQDEPFEKANTSNFGLDTQTTRMEAIAVPRGMGIVGITRAGTGGAGVNLVTPPFAIRFNRHGQLVAEDRMTLTDADVTRNFVYYSPSGAKTVRAGGYDVRGWDPDITADISSKWNSGLNEWNQPFQGMESVVGVVVYSKADFEDAGGALVTGSYTAPLQGCTGGCGSGAAGVNKWMFENGTVLFFSRNTGNVLRYKQP